MAGWPAVLPSHTSDRAFLRMMTRKMTGSSLYKYRNIELERTDSTSNMYDQYQYHRHYCTVTLNMIIEQNLAP